VAVFQPHTTHRTATLLDEFAAAFGDADRVILAPVYRPAGREADERPVTSSDLATRMARPDARAVESLAAAFDALVGEELRPGTLILTLGAGDVTLLGPAVLAQLEALTEHPATVVEQRTGAEQSGPEVGDDAD
jgi:UDP-N-acetylmuramate--alanine ligase